MKKLISILLLTLAAVTGHAQNTTSDKAASAELTFDSSIDWNEFKKTSAIAARKAAQETNRELGLDSSVAITNAKILPGLLKEFEDAAVYNKVHYSPELSRIKKVIVVSAHPAFIASVSDNRTIIKLNSELLKYPNLLKAVLFNQLGQIYGLKLQESGHQIMSKCWSIDAKHEAIAEYGFSKYFLKGQLFEALAKKKPLPKQI